MNDHNNDDVVQLWQSQDTTALRTTADEMLRRVKEMDRQERRAVIDVYAAFTLIALVMTALAVLTPNVFLRVGAALSMLGFAFIPYQVRRYSSPHPPSEPDSSVTMLRAALQRRLDFINNGLWARVMVMAPGPLLFSIGMAIAYPKAALIVYVQIATFLIVLLSIVPLNRRKAVAIQRELDELGRLES